MTPTFAALLAALATASAVVAISSADGPPTGVEATSARPSSRLLDIAARLGASRPGRRVRRERLAAVAVGAECGWTLDALVGAKLAGSFVAAVGGLATVWPLAVPLGLVAWRVPEFVLARRARRRVAAASGDVPLFLDLLAVATSAGVAPQLAVRLAADRLHAPLGGELALAIERTDLGRRWRDEVAAVGERLALPDLRRALALLSRSEALGSSLADEMARLAADVRAERRARAAERARTAPVKMLFPLVFLILPAFLLLTVVPVLLSTVRSIG